MEENTQVSASSVGLRYGLFLGIGLMVYSTVLQLAGQGGNQTLTTYLLLAIVTGVIVLAQKNFKDQGDGYMSFGKGFTVGSLVLLISTLLNSLFTYVYLTLIDTAAMDAIVEAGREEGIRDMEERGMSDAEIDQALELTDMFLSAEFITGVIFLTIMFFGLILVLIITAFTQKKNPVLEL